MIKHIIALVALSAAVVVAMPHISQGMQLLLSAHAWVAQLLTDVFTGGPAGNVARGLLALLSIPVIVGFVPAVLYYAVRRRLFPYFMQIVWIVWLVQAGALIAIFKVATLSVN